MLSRKSLSTKTINWDRRRKKERIFLPWSFCAKGFSSQSCIFSPFCQHHYRGLVIPFAKLTVTAETISLCNNKRSISCLFSAYNTDEPLPLMVSVRLHCLLRRWAWLIKVLYKTHHPNVNQSDGVRGGNEGWRGRTMVNRKQRETGRQCVVFVPGCRKEVDEQDEDPQARVQWWRLPKCSSHISWNRRLLWKW